jgi:hypothetical protein
MKLTREELNRFHSFAVTCLGREEGVSLEDLVQRWNERREYEETVMDIQQGVQDHEAGRKEPLRDAIADIRAELGLPE